MEKAFAISDLVARFKAKGLDLAEETAKLVVGETLDWIQDSVVLTETKIDDLAAPAIAAVKPFVMSQIDKIDGQVG